MAKRIAILGSTGSIGTNALRVIEALGADYEVFALTAHNNVSLLAEQCETYKPAIVGLTNPEKLAEFENLTADYRPEILCGPNCLEEIAGDSAPDVVLTAVVGAAGLPAVLRAAERGKTLAIANKEPLVTAGRLVTRTAGRNGAAIVPVDSEHSAVFQAMQAGSVEEVRRVVLTASGGPFRNADPAIMAEAGVTEALDHPTWNMGQKITIDSATMMNKALEVIEAVNLFGLSADKISVLIHPESIVHSMVEFVDGSVIAQMGLPDMCVPIQYALTYPARKAGISERLRLEDTGSLTFERPDCDVFRSLKLGFMVAETTGTEAAVFNAANEKAVEEFLSGKIKFGVIVELIEHCLERHKAGAGDTLDELLEADLWARNEVSQCLKEKV